MICQKTPHTYNINTPATKKLLPNFRATVDKYSITIQER